jgi:putative thioredoxin
MDKELQEIKRKKLQKLIKEGGDKMETEIEVNDSNFNEDVIEASKTTPILVDFWAEWCAPCKMLGPILEKLAKDYSGKFILAKADLYQNQQKAAQYNVRSIPNVKMFRNGSIIDEFIGAMPSEHVKEWLNKNISQGN